MRREKHIFLKNGSGIFFAAGLDMISDKAKLFAALRCVVGRAWNEKEFRSGPQSAARKPGRDLLRDEHTPWFGLSPTSGQ
jgi:hypothetical protein